MNETIVSIDKRNLIRKQISVLVEQYAEIVYANKAFTPGIDVIPPSGKLLDGEELKLMVEASLDGWLTAGRFNEAFEEKLAKFLGAKYLLTVNSGSSANLVAFNTLTSPKLGERAIKPGDEVIGVAAGFPTTVNPIIQYGAVPVFVDIEIPTYNIDASKVEAAITSKTKAIMLAHTLGNPFNLDVITGLCKKYGLWLIEDCCDALGSTYNNQMVGTFGDIATLSFYPAHHLTMGEGGAVFTNNLELKQIAESFRDWGRDCYCPPGRDNTCGKRFCQNLGDLPMGYDHKYTYSHLGYNLKITDMQAACGLAQLEKAKSFIEQRKKNYQYLSSQLKDCEEFLILPEPTNHSDPSWFGFPITLRKPSSVDRVDLLTYLDQEKIGTRLLFAGNLTRQPYMKDRNYRVSGELKNTDTVMRDTFWVGVQPALSEQMLEHVIQKTRIFFGLGF
jgi:CDP-6-deoxy-D-xylo-4-hexulose-3-dehydrase